MPCVRIRTQDTSGARRPYEVTRNQQLAARPIASAELGWLGINRHRGNFDPVRIQNRNAPRRIDCRLVEQNAYGEDSRLLDCSRVIFAIRPGRVHEPLTVFDIENVATTTSELGFRYTQR